VRIPIGINEDNVQVGCVYLFHSFHRPKLAYSMSPTCVEHLHITYIRIVNM